MHLRCMDDPSKAAIGIKVSGGYKTTAADAECVLRNGEKETGSLDRDV